MPVDINNLTDGWLELESDPGKPSLTWMYLSVCLSVRLGWGSCLLVMVEVGLSLLVVGVWLVTAT